MNPFLCPSHFWQAQIISLLVGLRTYQHPGRWEDKTDDDGRKENTVLKYGLGCFETA